MQALSLEEIIKLLEKSTGLKISICDVTGILQNENMRIDFEYRIHSSELCRYAKTTQKGLKLCLRCKSIANDKAVNGQKPFCGACAYGIYEAVYPVVIDYRVKCIIYIGNFTLNNNITETKINRACNVTGVDIDTFFKLSKNLLTIDEHSCYDVAKIIESYILLLYNSTQENKNHNTLWVVQNIINYINENFKENINLKECAEMYFMNEKYLGRKFQEIAGISFRQYLNKVRLENAKNMLVNTKNTVTDIAIECGYNDVTYFNRVFKKECKTVPLKYREDFDEKNI